MNSDRFTAVWVSHSSISDFLRCPRSYFLKNVYKDPKTGHKIKIISPPLALGQVVHQVLEEISVLPVEKRFSKSLLDRLEEAWFKISGEKGGFKDKQTEKKYRSRAREMLSRVTKHPGPLKNKAVKVTMDLPWFWLSEKDNIILCGKIDWLEYLPKSNSVHIIDFKTGKGTEPPGSLQLPIYHLLTDKTQKREVKKASYWYLEKSDQLAPKKLPDLKESEKKVLKVAKKVKLARQLERFKCPSGETGCRYCRPLERVLKGEGKQVGVDQYGSDVYILDSFSKSDSSQSVLL